MPQKAQVPRVQKTAGRQYHVRIVIGKKMEIVIDGIVYVGAVRNELFIVGTVVSVCVAAGG